MVVSLLFQSIHFERIGTHTRMRRKNNARPERERAQRHRDKNTENDSRDTHYEDDSKHFSFPFAFFSALSFLDYCLSTIEQNTP